MTLEILYKILSEISPSNQWPSSNVIWNSELKNLALKFSGLELYDKNTVSTSSIFAFLKNGNPELGSEIFFKGLLPGNYQGVGEFDLTLFSKAQSSVEGFSGFSKFLASHSDLNCLQVFQASKYFLGTIALNSKGFEQAICLSSAVNLFVSTYESLLTSNESDNKELNLICLDLSGIQNFIYQISSKFASKALRGRSFYLQLITELASIKLNEQLGINAFSSVIASGGKAYFIAPKSAKIDQGLLQFQNEMQSIFWKEFGGSLYITISSVGFDPTILKSNSDFQSLWAKITESNSSQKLRKFDQLINSEYGFNQFFETPIGGNEDWVVCPVTNRAFSEKEMTLVPTSGNLDEKQKVSKQVSDQIKLGEQLAKGKYLSISNLKSRDSIKCLDSYITCFSEFPEQKNSSDLVISLEPFNPSNKKISKIDIFKNYSVDSIAKNQLGNPKNHDELVASGTQKLGILRMDVDNLGSLFSKGFPEGKLTFYGQNTLSLTLDAFFTQRVSQIRNRKTYKDHVSIIYAGGDDLFAVGLWEKLFEFATEISSEFGKLACNRTSLFSVSGGLAMTNPSFPIAKAADLSGEAEKLAKNYISNLGNSKNAITFLGHTLSFKDELANFKKAFARLKQLLNEEKISKGFLNDLVSTLQQQEEAEKKALFDGSKYIEDPSYKWTIPYRVVRNIKDKSIQQELNKYLTSGQHPEFNQIPFKHFALAARKVLLEQKTSKI